MSTATLDRPHHPAHEAPRRGSNFSGTLGMLRLYLRRDRVVLPLWVLLLSVPLAPVYIESVAKVYPTQADRAGFVASIMASPAQRAMFGQVYNDSLGAALLLSFGASIATGAIGGAGLLSTDVPPAGSLAFGAALACSGLVFTAVAAVAAQLSP